MVIAVAKTILVTGGAGFIGSHLCEFLLNRGHEVICLDNFFTGSKDNVKHLLNHPNFELIRHDIIQPIMIEADEIYNLACPASPIHYQFNPVETVKTNVMGAINMLELTRKCKAKILQASTSEVYGNPKEHPQKESYHGNVNPLSPRACYDEGKRIVETLMMDYHREHRVDIRIARIFNTYGPRMALNDGRVISNFIVQALKGEPLTIYGEGSQTRSFCYVSNLIGGLVTLMESNQKCPINLGNPNEFTILQLANKIIELTASQSKIIFKSLPADDPVRRRPDINLAKSFLNWEPTIQLEEGLRKTINYFRDILN
ncbi:SDR family oxidoreductase [Candidatus Woesearchaeota archaeon]|nr:SDR family oxidoreductase [Candidatus Woesearchaeota archaeon]